MGGFFMKKYRLELSLAIGLAAMLLCCAAEPQPTLQWWSAAFSPLCGGILAKGGTGGGIVLRCKLLELLAQLAQG